MRNDDNASLISFDTLPPTHHRTAQEMPWLSPAASPVASPRIGAPARPQPQASSSVMYVPPLIDGACGTLPNAQQPALALMRRDVRAAARMLPGLMRAVWGSETRSWRCWSDVRMMALHGMLLVLESYMLLFAAPLFLGLPGVMFVTWLAGCMAMVMGLSHLLNGSDVVLSCKAGTDGWMMGQETDDERWFFVGGMAQR